MITICCTIAVHLALFSFFDIQAWFPDQPAGASSDDDAKKKALMEKNKAALEKRKAALQAKQPDDSSKPLPEGWRRVESRSRPGGPSTKRER